MLSRFQNPTAALKRILTAFSSFVKQKEYACILLGIPPYSLDK
jgi:hypothetical protein